MAPGLLKCQKTFKHSTAHKITTHRLRSFFLNRKVPYFKLLFRAKLWVTGKRFAFLGGSVLSSHLLWSEQLVTANEPSFPNEKGVSPFTQGHEYPPAQLSSGVGGWGLQITPSSNLGTRNENQKVPRFSYYVANDTQFAVGFDLPPAPFSFCPSPPTQITYF